MQTFPSRKAGGSAAVSRIASRNTSVVGRARPGGRGARGRRWRPGKESRKWSGKEEGDARSPSLANAPESPRKGPGEAGFAPVASSARALLEADPRRRPLQQATRKEGALACRPAAGPSTACSHLGLEKPCERRRGSRPCSSPRSTRPLLLLPDLLQWLGRAGTGCRRLGWAGTGRQRLGRAGRDGPSEGLEVRTGERQGEGRERRGGGCFAAPPGMSDGGGELYFAAHAAAAAGV
jgi:hypothetical protein